MSQISSCAIPGLVELTNSYTARCSHDNCVSKLFRRKLIDNTIAFAVKHHLNGTKIVITQQQLRVM
ncbi:uncharacterized protein PHALS_07855 [Plasmopara halstedii]|uniref:Uncharacterized protein n=1 Tax=Plasmopara halstedii TaxID=4781 RepID=A0A0P1B7N0_PLAHL|nr:uncharacterized protein PHALS_07855 [Plasmopara halstedii]CEG50129.1 hypothetical protein PHALS_07855 [Plasmopara halstedii]|eukprot:XP_024586498.1 hypothetical protein PHALS_07855 [Plasmopara halstedii]